MNERNIDQRLLEVASKILNVKPDELDLNSSPDSVDTWDSLTHLIMFIEIQKVFGISFTTQEISTLKSLRLIYDEIIKRF